MPFWTRSYLHLKQDTVVDILVIVGGWVCAQNHIRVYRAQAARSWRSIGASVLRTTLSLVGRCVIDLFLVQATEAGGDYIRVLNPVSPFVWCVCMCLVCVRRGKGFYILVN